MPVLAIPFKKIPAGISPDISIRLDRIQWRTWTDEDGVLRYATSRLRPLAAEDLDHLVQCRLQYELDKHYGKVPQTA